MVRKLSRRSFLEAASGGTGAVAGYVAVEEVALDAQARNKTTAGRGQEMADVNQITNTLYAESLEALRTEYETPNDGLGAITREGGVYVSSDGEWVPFNQNPSFESVATDTTLINDSGGFVRAPGFLRRRPSRSRASSRHPGRLVEDFEDLSEFTVTSGSLTADTSTQFVGGQSAKLTLDGGEDASITRSVSLDADGTLPSIAMRLSKPKAVTFYVIMNAPDRSNRVVYQQTGLTIQNPTGWFRLSPGVSPESSGSPDLTDVEQIRYKFMTHTDETIDCWIDDMRVVETPDTGKLVLQWDDSRDYYYSQPFDDMERYGYPMSHATLTGQVGDDGRMTLDELREIQRAGGEIGSHTHNHIDATEHTLSEVREEVEKSKRWLVEHDFTGDFLVWPHVNFNSEHVDVAEEYFAFSGSNSQANEHNFQGAGFDPMVYTRLIGYDLETMKNFVARIDEHDGIGVINLHGYEDTNTVERSEFREFLHYVHANHVSTGGVDVVTFQDLAEYL